MSRSNPTNYLERPCTKYLKWHGGNIDEDGGRFTYWDKEADNGKGGKGVDVEVDLTNFSFLVLDFRLFSVTGYNEPTDTYCFSNEVRTVKDKLVIRSFGNKSGAKPRTVVEGPYSEIKPQLETLREAKGLKYTRCIYILWEGEICHMTLSGAAFQHWMETIERYPKRAERDWVNFVEVKPGQKGKVKFTVPVFEFGDSPEGDEAQEATEADRTVQAYLKEYLKKNGSQEEKGGDDGSSGEGSDPANWRDYFMGEIRMGTLNFDQIREYFYNVEEGSVDQDYYTALKAAFDEYKSVETTWETAKVGGRPIREVDLKLLQETAKKMQSDMPMHRGRIKLEYGIEVLLAEARKTAAVASSASSPEEEEDDIPF